MGTRVGAEVEAEREMEVEERGAVSCRFPKIVPPTITPNNASTPIKKGKALRRLVLGLGSVLGPAAMCWETGLDAVDGGDTGDGDASGVGGRLISGEGGVGSG